MRTYKDLTENERYEMVMDIVALWEDGMNAEDMASTKVWEVHSWLFGFDILDDTKYAEMVREMDAYEKMWLAEDVTDIVHIDAYGAIDYSYVGVE